MWTDAPGTWVGPGCGVADAVGIAEGLDTAGAVAVAD
jgi:hypothetical protein